jgi:alpha-L-fucosidase 2
MATGWSLAWKINFWARLEDGNHAYKLIQMLLTPERTYANLFDAHPPFQIDGNFGAVSGINEMLVQSQNDEINFLPALPDRWSDGSFRGIRARKGFVIDTLIWSSKTVSRAVITSLAGGTCNLRHKTATKSIETEAGMTYAIDASLNVTSTYKKGETSINGNANRLINSDVMQKMGLPVVKVLTNAGKINIQITGKTSDVSIRVFNLSGRTAYGITQKVELNSNVLIPQMRSGIYLVNVSSEGMKHSEKILIP